MKIKYIGKRQSFVDGAYGTKTVFDKGEEKDIDDELAKKLLRHPDQFLLVDDKSAGKSKKASTKESDEKAEAEKLAAELEANGIQEAHDSIANMDLKAVADFVQNTFHVNLDEGLDVAAARQYASQLVDQYGIN